jgi:hypothetical protein
MNNEYVTNILRAKEILGGFEALGRVCDTSGNAIKKWVAKGRPPRTEYSGETQYAKQIAKATKNQVKASGLLPKLK